MIFLLLISFGQNIFAYDRKEADARRVASADFSDSGAIRSFICRDITMTEFVRDMQLYLSATISLLDIERNRSRVLRAKASKYKAAVKQLSLRATAIGEESHALRSGLARLRTEAAALADQAALLRAENQSLLATASEREQDLRPLLGRRPKK